MDLYSNLGVSGMRIFTLQRRYDIFPWPLAMYRAVCALFWNTLTQKKWFHAVTKLSTWHAVSILLMEGAFNNLLIPARRSQIFRAQCSCSSFADSHHHTLKRPWWWFVFQPPHRIKALISWPMRLSSLPQITQSCWILWLRSHWIGAPVCPLEDLWKGCKETSTPVILLLCSRLLSHQTFIT